jgi:(p)ppGpp synthase/HD superfamily hydrolase
LTTFGAQQRKSACKANKHRFAGAFCQKRITFVQNLQHSLMNQPWRIDVLQDAWQLATKLHGGQKYGGPEEGQQIEYINHIGSVIFEILAALNREAGMNAELAILCAILHDTIEDTTASYEYIFEKFGAQTADSVLALTKNSEIADKEQKMLDSLKRIKTQPKEVWAVKMADRISNLYAPPYYWTNEKKAQYLEEAELIHAELQTGNAYLAQRLAEKIENYKRFID